MKGVHLTQKEIKSISNRVDVDTSMFLEGSYVATFAVDGIVQMSRKFIVIH